MKLFKKKSGDSHRVVQTTNKNHAPAHRRNTRLLLLQMRKIAMLTAVLALIGSAGYAGYHNNAFKKCGNWLVAQALTHSANAGFKVKEILVTGRKQIPAAELLAHLSIKQGVPILGVNIAEAQQSLMDIAWVKGVVITRRLPDTIVVALQERTPVALWQHQGRIALIDGEGAVLTTDNLDTWQSLPLVVGTGAEKNVAALLDTLQTTPGIAGTLVSAVRVEERRWDLHLRNDIIVKLPEQDMEQALGHLAALEEQKNILGRNISGIDLRQPDRIMITPINTSI